jgi:preprotein translocase subunit SecA
METLGLRDGESIEHRMISHAIENAQKRVEGHNFEIRKTLLDYDNVMNQQREVIYSLRRDAINREDTESAVMEFLDDTLNEMYSAYDAARGKLTPEEEEQLQARLQEVFNLKRVRPEEEPLPSPAECRACVLRILEDVKASAPEIHADILRYFMLEELDRSWKEHLLNMDHLRDGIGLRGYGQRDPKQEYKSEGFAMFQEMIFSIQENLFKALTRLRIQVEAPENAEPADTLQGTTLPGEPATPGDPAGNAQNPSDGAGRQGKKGISPFTHKDRGDKLSYSRSAGEPVKKVPQRRETPKIGRNDECPCGSGKKYKKCCGMGK